MQDLALAQALPAVLPPALIEDPSSQRNIMENTSSSTPSGKGAGPTPKSPMRGNDGGAHPGAKPAAPEHAPHQAAVRPAPTGSPARLKIRYGRMALALLGVLALLTAIAGTMVSFIGLISPLLPIAAFLVALGTLVALRALAVRGRAKRAAARVDAAFREAMNPKLAETAANDQAQPASKQASTVFDAETANAAAAKAAEAAKPAPAPMTAAELREAALAVAAESGDTAIEPAKPTWEPVAVPKPTYVEAAKAERPAPLPLDLPAEPKPEGKPSIKASATAPKVEVKIASGATAQTTQESQAMDEGSKHVPGLSNLDDVLQRRRA